MTAKQLFSPIQLGDYRLQNRVAMAPMTRCRAEGNVPNEMMAKYYGARSSAGLLITEGVSPSPNGLGYARIPGCYTSEQVAGWQTITKAAHDGGARIFIQLMHTGRVSHPANMPKGTQILAPSAVQLSGEMWTDSEQMQPYATPEAMTVDQIKEVVAEYVHAAKFAIDAGFDGVELHAANGYLLDQFLNPASNTRQDEYGGSCENRRRLTLEVARAVTREIGAPRVGMRISPYGVFNDMEAYDGMEDSFVALAGAVSELGMTYLHLVDHAGMGAPAVPDSIKEKLRTAFTQTLILSGGYDTESAERDLVANRADLIAFGRPYISNPDLVEKMKAGTELSGYNDATFYTPGEEGYLDY